MSENIHCTNCGSKSEPTTEFCSSCGNNLQKQTSLQPNSSVEPAKKSSAPQMDLKSGDFTIEASEFSVADKYQLTNSRIRVIKNEDYVLSNTYNIRDHTGKISFKIIKTGKLRANYTVYDGIDVVIGELKGNTIIESQTKAKSKISYQKKSKIGIETPTGNITGNYALTDKDYIINLYDHSGNMILAITKPRQLDLSSVNHSDKSKMMTIATIRSKGQLSPFVACAIGLSMNFDMEKKNFMKNRDIQLFDKTTEIFVNRSGFLSTNYIFSDAHGTELLRGKQKKLSKTMNFVDPSGIIGSVKSGGLLSAKYAITEMKKETIIDLSSSTLTFRIENETFTFGDNQRREIYDSKGNLVFTILGWDGNFKLDIKKKMTTNFWCMFATIMMPIFVTSASAQ